MVAAYMSLPREAIHTPVTFSAGDGLARSTVEVAQWLVAQPKPLRCDAIAEEGAVRIVGRPLTNVEVRKHDALPEFRSAMQHLLAGMVPDRTKALCVARGEALMVPMVALDLFEQSYVIMGVSFAADIPGSPWADHWDLTAAGRARGAGWIVRFSEPGEGPYITNV
jgi:hypothetical protein